MPIWTRTPGYFIATSMLIISLPSAAADYVVTKGERFELCRELADNLNTFKDEPPLLCGLKFNPKFTNFRSPKWEMMDARENIEVAQMVLHSTPLSKWDQARLDEGKLVLQKGDVDINFDGRTNVVYRVELLDCDPAKENPAIYGSRNVYIHPIENDPDSRAFRAATERTLMPYDIFYYKGRPYLYSWSSGGFVIEETSSPRRKFYESFASWSVCYIDYRP